MIRKAKEFFKRIAFCAHEGAKRRLPLEHGSKLQRFFAWGLYMGLIGLAVLLIISIFAIGIFSIGLPDVRDFDELAGVESTLILDRDGKILYAIHGEENRKYVPLSEISSTLQKATIAIEDDEFFFHSGFDLPGIIKAVCHEIIGNLAGLCPPRGGSTITQQLAKNAFFSPKRTYARKLRELIMAIRLERAYDKSKILELYLNRIPYGGQAYGAELAAQIFFGKTARELNLAESAILASLPKAPTFYSPYGDYVYSSLDHQFTTAEILQRNIRDISGLSPDEFTRGLVGKTIQIADDRILYLPGRVDIVLGQMEKLAMITEEEKNAALKETHQIEFKRYRANIRAPHFVFYVRRLLEEEFGKEALEQGLAGKGRGDCGDTGRDQHNPIRCRQCRGSYR